MMKKFLSELYGKELKDEDLPEELRPAKTNDKDNEDDKQQIVFKTDQPSFFMPFNFNHYGVERCQWTTNPKACPTCAEYARHNDGVYRVKDVPTLPAHPNCRCALSAYWKDDKDNTLTTDVNIIRKCLDKYHADFLKATGIDISKSIENGTFSDASNPYNDVKAKFINYLLEKRDTISYQNR